MILLASIFNWSIAIAYVLVGIVLAVLGGTLIGRAKMENNVEAFVLHNKVLDLPQEQLTLRDRLNYAREQVAEVIQRVWLYVLVGVCIGAAIHNWIPEALITTLLGEERRPRPWPSTTRWCRWARCSAPTRSRRCSRLSDRHAAGFAA